MDWYSADNYTLSRLLIARGLAAVYLVAFLVTLNQFRALLGERGLLPSPNYLARTTFRQSPSIFHFHYSDRFLSMTAGVGAILSALLLIGLFDHLPTPVTLLVWFTLWVLYLSIMNIGRRFYSFGWESLLVETGFLGIFLGTPALAPATPLIWLFRWLVFRLEFGAGLIKLRGDSCWRDLTCLYYHHETQPMPNRLSWYFHHLPKPFHRAEVVGNFAAQLVAPVLLLAPQPIANIAGGVIVITQLWLMVSGNFSWLNAITIVVALSAFDNEFLETILPFSAPSTGATPGWYQGCVLALFAIVVVLSYRPVRNMASPSQAMNASFNPLHLVNTYGAFGSVTRVRNEIVIEGTADVENNVDSEWKEYEFKGKPGDPHRRPPQIAPYHLRLDWLMWFAALSPAYGDEWLLAFVVKLLENDRQTLKLIRQNPFPETPPTLIRAKLYRYRFTTFAEHRETKAWWQRELVGEFLPPISLK